ncbi:MAG: sigma-70 family RNA polymerase sigma factor [Pseudomonadota bacterium]
MTLDDPDDDALFKATGEGDQIAFNRLVQRHAPRLYAIARRYGCATADADEIVQDTFWRAWNSAGDWQPGGAKVATWLYRIAVNRIIDHRRSIKRRPEDPMDDKDDFVDAAASPEQALDDRQKMAFMQAAIGALPDRQRMAIILSTQQGKSNAEIARIFDVTEGAVEQLMVRARRALRESYRRLQ